jgi:hypothetical protein
MNNRTRPQSASVRRISPLSILNLSSHPTQEQFTQKLEELHKTNVDIPAVSTAPARAPHSSLDIFFRGRSSSQDPQVNSRPRVLVSNPSASSDQSVSRIPRILQLPKSFRYSRLPPLHLGQLLPRHRTASRLINVRSQRNSHP